MNIIKSKEKRFWSNYADIKISQKYRAWGDFMNERINKLCGEMYDAPVKDEFDRMDIFLPEAERDVKRICEYILNQQPKLTKYSAFTGFFNFDGSVVGDVFNRSGYPHNSRARGGLTALMNAVLRFDTHGISGAAVTNFNLDESSVKNEESFEKTVDMLEAYLRNGGIRFQLNHIGAQELRCARREPEKHRALRVRVTGYSEFFTNLEGDIQDSIIRRYD